MRGSASGEYALALDKPRSTRTIEVGLSVCSEPSLAGTPGDPKPSSFQPLSAVAEERGLLIITDEPLPIGTRVALEVRLSRWTKLCVFGYVRWHGSAAGKETALGVGIAFDDLPAVTRTQLIANLGLEQLSVAPSDPGDDDCSA